MEIKPGQILQYSYPKDNLQKSLVIEVQSVNPKTGRRWMGLILNNNIAGFEYYIKDEVYLFSAPYGSNWRLIQDVGLRCVKCQRHYPKLTYNGTEAPELYCWECQIQDL